MNLAGKIMNVARDVVIIGMFGLTCWNMIDEKKKEDYKKEITKILDVNEDGKLSRDEIKRFYDEAGIELYTEHNLWDEVRMKDYEKFLKMYKD